MRFNHLEDCFKLCQRPLSGLVYIEKDVTLGCKEALPIAFLTLPCNPPLIPSSSLAVPVIEAFLFLYSLLPVSYIFF